MSEKKSMVRSAFGFAAVIIIIAGAMFGLNVNVDIEDAEVTEIEQVEAEVVETEVADVLEDANVPPQTEVDETQVPPTESSPVEETPTEEEVLVDAEVAEPTENEITATEGEVENA